MTYRQLAAWAVLALTACAQNPSTSQMVRICDDRGCADRPKNQTNLRASDTEPQADTDGRMAALKQAGETNPRAAYDLGLRYFRGDGVPQDSYQALVWMRKAAERGDLPAQKALGSFYLFGLEEMGPDPREAEKWLLLASGRGDQESTKLLEQARAAKRADEDDYRWLNESRALYYSYWNSGYAYRGQWQERTWHWY
ncbi:tetratricopeptide repeat protein [Paraburkholderia sp. BCC1884]|uniref:tetratricopeptide repeat protein n=1 Tax=Paraburkholderia sp. BCC1884 TaxID=2562668 RepID=UPI001183C498|nr:SEL1-like repeat protein [Paraburkholderia sp. BCC1884]